MDGLAGGSRTGLEPRPAWISTRSLSAPAFPASISSTSCANSVSRARVFEAGTGVGGTWYWNRYPGARFDSESWTYGYSFSQELLDEWDWEEHFAPQPETERYLNYVADKFDLRRDIQFNSRVKAAHYQEETRSWDVDAGGWPALRDALPGHRRRRAVGGDDADHPRRRAPSKGQSCHTHYWPKEPVRLRGQARRGDRHRRDRRADHHRKSPRPPAI